MSQGHDDHEHDSDGMGFGFVCPDCAPRAGAYAGQDPSSFVGKLVKVAFNGINPENNKESKEHMWIRVRDVAVNDWLRGTLINKPYFRMNFQYGDTVALKVSDIEEVMDDPQPKAN